MKNGLARLGEQIPEKRLQAADANHGACKIQPYFAPRPKSTAGIVRIRIVKSSHNDQLSM
jgi:hypothetical protein